MSDVTQIMRGISPDLKAAIREACATQRLSMNTLLVKILADEFRVRYVPNGQRLAPIGDASVLVLRMPGPLRRRIKMRAASQGETQRDVMVRVLSARLGVEFAPSPSRRAA